MGPYRNLLFRGWFFDSLHSISNSLRLLASSDCVLSMPTFWSSPDVSEWRGLYHTPVANPSDNGDLSAEGPRHGLRRQKGDLSSAQTNEAELELMPEYFTLHRKAEGISKERRIRY